MFIVAKRSDLLRFGLFLGLAVVLIWYVVGRMESWRLSQGDGGEPLAVSSPLPGGEEAPGLANAQPPEAVALPDLEGVGLGPSEGRDYFAEYRVDRERTRGALGERLREIMGAQGASDEVRREASQQYLRLGEVAALESRAESMVRASGFDDVIVHLNEGSAQVVVRAAKIDQRQFIQIVDAVSRVTGLKSTAITVMPKER